MVKTQLNAAIFVATCKAILTGVKTDVKSCHKKLQATS